MQQAIFGNVRVQIYDGIIRLEQKNGGKFYDGNTFFVPDRKRLGDDNISEPLYSVNEGIVTIADGKYTIIMSEDQKTLRGIRVEDENGKTVYKYKKDRNWGELPEVGKAPVIHPIFDTPRVIIPEGGYTYHGKNKKNSGYKIDEKTNDVYLLLCEKDDRKLRQLYINLTGPSELVRLSTLGLWDSRYYKYTQAEAEQRIRDYQDHDVPIDNIVIDTDWRAALERGIGYDINTELFPDMKKFFKFAHKNNVEVMFNDHPEPFKPELHVFDPEEVKYREEHLTELLKMGLDTWWYDRNWSTHLNTPTTSIPWETFGLYLFEDITRHYYQKKAKNTQNYRRPVVMGNVSNIINGMYTKQIPLLICDTASHRYSIQWTGDISSGYDSLANEVKNLVECGANEISYINCDLGGHTGNPDAETYLRWVQFGVLSPVFRPHCTNYVERTREPWIYGEETLKIARKFIKMRYHLLPLIYERAHNNYETGEPIFAALGFYYPDDKKALKVKDEYMLGANILAAPMFGNGADYSRKIYLPSGTWTNVFNGKNYVGGRTINFTCDIGEMPLFVKDFSIIPLALPANNTKEMRWDKIVLEVFAPRRTDMVNKRRTSSTLYEDDTETTAYKLGQFRTTDIILKDCKCGATKVIIEPAVGEFDGAGEFTEREYTLKIHTNGTVSGVSIGDDDLPFEVLKKSPDAFPFDTEDLHSTSDVATVTFKAKISEKTIVSIWIK